MRIARALGHGSPGLVLLDEAFRGLDAPTRARLLARIRDRYRQTTLVCITHDVAATRGFDRVIVIADGAVVADDTPGALAQIDGPYRTLLDKEADVGKSWWGYRGWRRWRVADGALAQGDP